MPNRDTGIRRNSVLKNCTIVAFVLALALTVCGIGAVWQFATHDKADWQLNHVELAPALAYFDANRDLLPIQDVQIVATALPCGSAADGWEEVTNLVTWRGTNLGCYHQTTVSTGTCATDNSNGASVDVREPTNLQAWATVTTTAGTPAVATNVGQKFCVQRVASQNWVAENQGSTCATSYPGSTPCGCQCIMPNTFSNTVESAVGTGKPGNCPISGYQITTGTAPTASANGQAYTKKAIDAAGTVFSWTDGVNLPTGVTTTQAWSPFYTRQQPNVYQVPAMGNLQVQLYGSACTNPNEAPADPSTQYALIANQQTAGCDADLGSDDMTQTVATMNEWQFYNANDDTVDAVLGVTWSAQLSTDLPTYEALLTNNAAMNVNLLNRQIITTACTQACNEFRFGTESTNILTMYGTIWNQIRLLGVVSMSCAVVALCMLTLIYIEGVRRQTQNYMTVLYAFCIVGLFMSVIYLWKANDILTRQYLPSHQTYSAAVTGNCLTGVWGNVLSTWYTHTNFTSLINQLWWTLACTLVLLVGGIIFAIIALMQLAKKKTVPSNYHTDNNEI